MDINFNIIKFIIFPKLEFLDQIRFRQVCKKFYKIDITDLYNIEDKFLEKLTDEILKAYSNVEMLNASNNPKITNLSEGKIILKNLKKLDASDYCGITDEGIKDLDLVELCASYNLKITNVNEGKVILKNLKKLEAGNDCGITDEGIKNLDLAELCASNNPKITNVSGGEVILKNLKILYADGKCGISDEGIKGLSLVTLYSMDNEKITKKY